MLNIVLSVLRLIWVFQDTVIFSQEVELRVYSLGNYDSTDTN